MPASMPASDEPPIMQGWPNYGSRRERALIDALDCGVSLQKPSATTTSIIASRPAAPGAASPLIMAQPSDRQSRPRPRP
jgi:hypothetical protein